MIVHTASPTRTTAPLLHRVYLPLEPQLQDSAVELARAGLTAPGPRAQALTELARPALDWVQLSRGLGVPAARAEAADALVQALERSLAEPGPQLIEAVL